ncbi:MAG: hypothetical protein GX146_08090 [Myxococcales bacterium]|jgi:hypothetical protein|nr:hypothetical protein [Myxococcales bacterium]
MTKIMKKISFLILVLLSSALASGCLPYLTEQRAKAIVDNLDVDQTLPIAEAELKRGGMGSQLTLWALRDQHITADQAQQIAALYFAYIDKMASRFDTWHLTWAISNMYRLGDDSVKAALEEAYRDATSRAAAIGGVTDKLVNGDKIKMGDAHGGGRAYAKGHLVAPGNPAYLQSMQDFEWRKGLSETHDPFWGPPDSRDFTPQGHVPQPSYVAGGGQLAKNERALLLYLDGELLPPAVMVGYRYGLLYWWEVGLDVGGDYGVFQALLNTKMENFKTLRTERFYWGTAYRTGYKYHRAELNDDLVFDDNSWVFIFDNYFSLRLGEAKKHALYLATQFYIDIDLRTPRRQTDYYVAPAMLGYEQSIRSYGNFFIQAGAAYAINGMDTGDEVRYRKSWFPVVQLGMAYRSGDRTAIRYTSQTRHMAGKKAGKLAK